MTTMLRALCLLLICTLLPGLAMAASTDPLPNTDDTVHEVALVHLGVHTSVVLMKGTEVPVPTDTLYPAGEVPAGKTIAVIYAPRTGECSLRDAPSDRGTILDKARAGVIVPVLEYGEEFCRISYDGMVGYVLTNCLTFQDTSAAPTGTGTLIHSGSTDGSTSINIRNTHSRSSAVIAKWPTGTVLTVFGHDGGWYEVESCGMRGFVQDTFLDVNESCRKNTGRTEIARRKHL